LMIFARCFESVLSKLPILSRKRREEDQEKFTCSAEALRVKRQGLDSSFERQLAI
jgi:hypothetical protein